jgi:hypothetical protein
MNEIEKEEFTKRFMVKEKERAFTENLSFYPDFKTKDFFHLLHTLSKVTKKRKTLFRGHSEASYRLFNKAQRSFLANEHLDNEEDKNNLYHDLILNMINTAKNIQNGILSSYFNAFGKKPNDVAILSFLQHHGAPTPILDWSENIMVALYFAIKSLSESDIQQHYEKKGLEIEHYFSIYALVEDNISNSVRDFKSLSINTNSSTDYNTLKKKKIAYINEQFRKGKPQFMINNSFRILNQKGVFVYNNSYNLPLEEIFLKQSFMYYLHYSWLDKEVPRLPILCININKCIAIDLKKDLIEKGYIESVMFPDPEEITRLAIPPGLRR